MVGISLNSLSSLSSYLFHALECLNFVAMREFSHLKTVFYDKTNNCNSLTLFPNSILFFLAYVPL